MGDRFLDRMAEIREKQGREPIDPTIIEGFESNTPPPPPLEYSGVRYSDDPDGELPEHNEYDEPSSPMIPNIVVKKVAHVDEPRVPVNLSTLGVDLLIVESEASYKGHVVVMTSSERAQVVGVILSALEREIADHRAQLITGHREQIISSQMKVSDEPFMSPKKRGRPKKNV